MLAETNAHRARPMAMFHVKLMASLLMDPPSWLGLPNRLGIPTWLGAPDLNRGTFGRRRFLRTLDLDSCVHDRL
jgi:hypothetical protein